MIVIDLLFYLCFKVNYKRSFWLVVPAICTDCILCVFYLMLLWLILMTDWSIDWVWYCRAVTLFPEYTNLIRQQSKRAYYRLFRCNRLQLFLRPKVFCISNFHKIPYICFKISRLKSHRLTIIIILLPWQHDPSDIQLQISSRRQRYTRSSAQCNRMDSIGK